MLQMPRYSSKDNLAKQLRKARLFGDRSYMGLCEATELCDGFQIL